MFQTCKNSWLPESQALQNNLGDFAVICHNKWFIIYIQEKLNLQNFKFTKIKR